MAARRMLLMLDNAHSAEQVRPLLPGSADCLVLITSRDSLSGLVALDGARRLVLQPLSVDAAIALLGAVAGTGRLAAEPEPAQELAQLCGLLPLALRIAGANLADAPDRSVAEQVALMRTNPLGTLEVSGDEAGGVRVAFDQSYGALAEPARRLFRLVSLTPGLDFAAATAVALAGERLAPLVDAHLVVRGPSGRYSMHDLIRAYARQRLAEIDPPGVRDQVAQWHVDGAASASALLHPGNLRAYAHPHQRFADAEEAQDWLDAERTNLIAAARQYAYEGPPWAAWQIADAIGPDLARRRQLVDLEAVATAAQRAADDADSPVGRAVAELNFGRIAWVLAAYADAQKRFTAAAEAAAVVWPHGVAEAYRGLGNVALESGQMPEAVDYYERALSLVDARAAAFHGSLNNNLGLVAAHLGQLDVAAARFEAVMRWARESGTAATLGQVLSNLGEVYRNLGRYAEAVPMFTEATAVHRRSGNISSEVACLVQLSYARLDGGDAQQAWEEATTARERTESADDPVMTAAVLNALGAAATGLHRYANARRFHEQALALAVELGHTHIELNAGVGLARVAMAEGRYADADAQATATLERASVADHGQQIVECLLLRAEAHRRDGFADGLAAEGFARQALAEARRSGLRVHADRALALLEGEPG
jgi:tetratricopeptide (TPR) repeat protein